MVKKPISQGVHEEWLDGKKYRRFSEEETEYSGDEDKKL